MKRILSVLIIFLSVSCENKSKNNNFTVVMIGDSITEWIIRTRDESGNYMSWEKELSKNLKANIISYAVAGWQTDDILSNIKNIIKLKTGKTIAFILIGINDFLAENRDVDLVLRNIIDIYSQLNLNGIKCIIQSILPIVKLNQNIPMKIKEINIRLKEFAHNNGIDFIDTHKLFSKEDGSIISDLFYDGLHLNLSGYRNWLNNAILPYLKSNIPQI
jgi:lysophospholipase L1-like esterase